MDPTLKAKWLADLRSGNFAQARKMLRLYQDGQTSFCCLGVLCRTVGAEWREWEWEDDEYFESVPVLNGRLLADTDDESITNDFAQEIGITSAELSTLIKMNDGHGVPGTPEYLAPKSFTEIADWIEANL
jgi:hypothetical protein